MTFPAAPLFLFDTNICIYLLNQPDRDTAMRIAQQLEQCQPGEVALSAISAAELLVGGERRGEVPTISAFINEFPILAFDEECAAHYAAMPFRRASFDRLIAATALRHDLVVVTNNVADFADIPGLKVENWSG